MVSRAVAAIVLVLLAVGSVAAGYVGVPAVLVSYAKAGEITDAAPQDAWDVAFIGAEPQREDVIAFSPPLIITEAEIDLLLERTERALDDTLAMARERGLAA
jgi:adenosylmethionine-8-amino-7-oxononanoate aminotransferase